VTIGALARKRQGESSDRAQGRTPIYLFNGSSEPVYTLVAAIVFIQGAAPRSTEEVLKAAHPNGENDVYREAPITTLSILPPGKWRVWILGTHWSGVLAGRSGGELAFTDRAGAHWIRRALGALEELPQAPFDYFAKWQLYGPYALEVPEPAESEAPSGSGPAPGEPFVSARAYWDGRHEPAAD
jgi:hypothetical protein